VSKISSKRLATMAGKYADATALDLYALSPNKLVALVRTLAGSVLSQTERSEPKKKGGKK